MIYQVTFLVQNEADQSVVKKTIESLGGVVVHERPLGQKSLIYPIKGLREAFYITYHIDIDPAAVTTLEQKLNFEEKVVRALIVKTERIIIPAPPKITEKPVEIAEIQEILPALQEAVLPAVPEKVEKTIVETPTKKETKPAKIEKKEKKPAQVSAQDEAKRLKALEEKLEEILKE